MGGIYGGSGVESEAAYNSNDNITIDVPYELADVTLRLDLSNYDHTTKTGATFTVTVVERHDHVFTDTWEKNDTYHQHKCQFENCTKIKDKADHSFKSATCTSKAVCVYCGNEYGEVDSSNHNLENTTAKDATVIETGNTEYWHCKDCGKYFADENGENELELDGKTLDEKNYTVKEGSTVVTLKADYVATLSAGEHTIGIVSTGGTAATTFTVNAKAVVNDDTNPDTGETTSPKTGDHSMMWLWFVLLFVSGTGIVKAAVYSKRKRLNKT